MLIEVTMHKNSGEKFADQKVTIFSNKVVGVGYSEVLQATYLVIEGGGVVQINETKEQILNLMGNQAQGQQ